MQVSEGAQKAGGQDWGAGWVRKAGRLGPEPLLPGVSRDCSDSLPCHIITQRWEQPWVCPGLEPLLLKHFWIADEFMLMRRLQITVNIKSSSGTPGVNISQRLPTSLCFSFASYKAIKQGRKKTQQNNKKHFLLLEKLLCPGSNQCSGIHYNITNWSVPLVRVIAALQHLCPHFPCKYCCWPSVAPCL